MMGKMLPDIPRFYTALAEWAACMVYILSVKRKLSGWRLAVVSAILLTVQAVFLVLTEGMGNFLWLVCMAVAVLLMIGFVALCIKGSWMDAVYCGLQAFVLAEFAASLEWQIYLFFFEENTSCVISLGFLILSYGVIFLFMWWLLSRQKNVKLVLNITSNELFAVILITISVFTMSNLSFLQVSTPFSSRFSDGVIIVRTMVDFAGVAMMYAYHVQRTEIRTRRELDVMQSALRNQYLQYQQSKESIDLINYKYHDLKHQIAVLREEKDPEKKNEFLDQMEEGIHLYEAQNKTGNSVVDTILTSKSVACEKEGITFNCVADGKLLDFMDVVDICSILGNALDNAIECEKKIPEPEKRLIHMAVFAQKNFVILRFENYFQGRLDMKEGIPLTTKKREKGYHGYGIKSIKYTVKKYEGAISLSAKDNWFQLKILIPRQGS